MKNGLILCSQTEMEVTKGNIPPGFKGLKHLKVMAEAGGREKFPAIFTIKISLRVGMKELSVFIDESGNF